MVSGLILIGSGLLLDFVTLILWWRYTQPGKYSVPRQIEATLIAFWPLIIGVALMFIGAKVLGGR